jgi:hypothetical protein
MASRTRVPTKVSGEHVFVESGVHVVVPSVDVNVSGSIVQISGQHVYVESGTHVVVESGVGVLISGQHVYVESGVYIIGSFTANVSGQPVTISGDHVFVESGVYVVTTPSGGGQVSGAVIVSGTVAVISGQISVQSGQISVESGLVAVLSGEVHIVSGIVDLKSPTTIKISGNPFVVTGDSGGNILWSGDVVGVTLKALSRNSGDVFVGGSTHPPSSGVGFILQPGEATSIDIDNMGQVRLCAQVSGDKITFMGVV